MSAWSDAINADALWTTVDSLSEALDKAMRPTTVEEKNELERVSWVVHQLEAHRQDSNSNAYTRTMLAGPREILSAGVLSNMVKYVQDPVANRQALTLAENNIEAIANQLATWPPLPARGQARSAGRVYADASRALQSVQDALEAKALEIAEDLKKASLARAEVEAEFATWRETAVEEGAATFKTETAAAVQIAKAELDKQLTTQRELVDQAASELKRLETITGDAANLAANFTQRGMAKDYADLARQRGRVGWVWDIVGFLSAATPIVFLLIYFSSITDISKVPVGATILRSGVTGAAVGLATYLFRRGRVERDRAHAARRAALRIGTARNFLSDQKPGVREAILEGMAQRIYLNDDLLRESADPVPELLQFLDRKPSAEKDAIATETKKDPNPTETK